MNHTYRVIYNESTNTFVAVSEIVSAKGKKSKGKKSASSHAGLAVATAVVAGVGGITTMPQNAEAAVVATTGTGRGTATASAETSLAIGNASTSAYTYQRSTAIGQGAQTAGDDAVAVGTSAVARGQANAAQSVAVGAGANSNYGGVAVGFGAASGTSGAGTSQSVAIGHSARAIGDQSLAIGANTNTTGNSSVSIGGDDLDRTSRTQAARTYTTLTGDTIVERQYTCTTTGEAAVAVGVQASAHDLAVAVGTRVHATGVGSVGIGIGSNASKDTSVALGAGSKTETDAVGVNSAIVNGVTYSGFAGGGAIEVGDQVAVGAVGYERQIKHVAPGAITETSTDAINGSQLYMIAKGLQETRAAVAGGANSYFHVNNNTTSQAAGNATTNFGPTDSKGGATGAFSLAAGVNASATTVNSVIVGTDAKSNNIHNAVVIGAKAEAATAAYVNNGTVHANYKNPYNSITNHSLTTDAIVDNARYTGDVRATDNGIQSSAVAVGYNSRGGHGGVAIGSDAVVTNSTNSNNDSRALGIAIGANAVSAGGGVVMGASASTSGVNAIALGRQASASGASAQAYGATSAAVGQGAFAMGQSATALGQRSIAIGMSTSDEAYDVENRVLAAGNNSIAFGSHARAGRLNSTVSLTTTGSVDTVDTRVERSSAFGYYANASATDAMAFGSNSTASALSSIAVGNHSAASSNHTIAIGTNANTTAKNNSALPTATTNALGSILIGANSHLKGAVGRSTNVGTDEIGDTPFVLLGYNTSSQSRFGDTIVGAWARTENPDFAINQGTVIGNRAIVYGDQGVAVGADTRALGNSSVAIGGDDLDRASGALKDLLGHENVDDVSKNYGTFRGDVGAGLQGYLPATGANGKVYPNTAAIGDASLAIGTGSQTLGVASNAIGANALAKGLSSTAIGTKSRAWGESSVAIGTNANASGKNAISIGLGNQVSGDNSGAFGDPSYVTGDGSYSVGNNNTVTTDNTFVLGSGVNRKADLTTNGSGTVANSVYLGADSEATAGAGVGTAVLDSEQVAGATTTAGDTGAVAEATVRDVTYGDFAGAKANGVVTVGSAGKERRIQNVAAGEISRTSTDAINGSQLYAVMDKMPVVGTVSNSDGKVTDGNPTNPNAVASTASVANAVNNSYWTLQNHSAEVGQVNPGDKVNFTSNDKTVTITATNEKDGVSALDFKVNVDNKTITVNDQGQLVANTGDGASPTTVTGSDAINVTGNPNDGYKVDANTTTLTVNAPAPTGNGKEPAGKVDAPTEEDGKKLVNASTVADAINNSGFTVAQNGEKSDKVGGNDGIVNAGDTLNFVNGTGTTARVTEDGGVTFDVKTTTFGDNSVTNGVNPNGTVAAPVDGDSFVNASTVANAINNSAFNLTTGGNTETTGVTDQVKAGSTVTISGGKAISVSQAGSEITINTKYDGTTITTNDAGDLQVANTTLTPTNPVGTTPATVSPIANPTPENSTKFVNAGDLANTLNNLGFNVIAGEDGGTTSGKNEKTAVKTGDTVTFNAGENIDIKQDGQNFTISAKVNANVANTTLSVGNDGKVEPQNPAEDGDKLVNATTVTDAINKAGFTVAQNGAPNNKVGGDDGIVNAGDVLDFVDGTGTTARVTENGGITFDVKTTTFGDNPTGVTNTGTVDAPKDGDSFVNASTIANTINNVSHSITIGRDDADVTDQDGKTDAKVKAGDTITLNSGKNLVAKQDGANITFATADDVVFNNVTTNNFTVPTGAGNNPVTINSDGISAGDKPITNVSSAVPTYTTGNSNGLLNLSAVPDNQVNNAATVADLQKMGWVVSSNKTTGNEATPFVSQVTNAKEVKFVGTGAATVSGSVDGDVNTITVHVSPAESGNPTTVAGSDNIKVDGSAEDGYTVSANTTTLTVNAPAPTGNGKEPAGKVDAPTEEDGKKLVNASTVADAINNSGFTVAQNGEKSDKVGGNDGIVNAGDTLNFVNGTGTTARVTEDGGVTFDVKTTTFGDNSVTNGVNPNGTVAAPVDGDSFVNASTVANAINNSAFNLTTGGNTETTGVTDQVKAGSTVTISGGKAISVSQAGSEITINTKYDGTTITTNDAGDLQVANTTLTPTNPVGTTPATVSPIANPTPENSTKFVNAGDLANTLNNLGFNVIAGEDGGTTSGKNEKTAVKTGDTVTFNAGENIDIKQDGQNFTISAKVNANVANTTLSVGNDGKVEPQNPAEDGDKLVNATTVTDAINKAGFTVAQNGAPNNKVGGDDGIVNAGDVLDFVDGTGTTARVTENGGITFDVKTTTFGDNPTGVTNTGTVDAPKDGDSFVNASTIANTINNVSHSITIGRDDADVTDQDGKTDAKVKAGDTITLNSGKNLVAKQDGANITFATDENVTFTNANASTVTVGAPGADSPITITNKDGKNVITNVTGNLPDTYNTDVLNKAGEPVTKAKTLGDVLASNPNLADSINNVATVGDVLNSGFNVKENNQDRDFIKAYDTVNFVDGKGTTANVTVNDEGTIANVTYNVKVDNSTVTVNDKGELVAAGKTVVAGGAGTSVTSATSNDGITTYTVSATGVETPTTNLSPNNNGTVSIAPTGNATDLVNADQITNAINNAGFNVVANGAEPKADGSDLVKAGETLSFVNGTGTTAVVTTSDDGKTTNVTYNSAVAYVNNNADDTSTPSNTAKLVGGDDTKPVQVQNVASGVREQAPVADVKAPTTAEKKGIADAITNATGDTLSNVANIGDVQAASNAAKTEVVEGTNMNVTSETGANGQTIYTVATDENVTFTNANASTVTVGAPGADSPITITNKDGKNVITNVTGNLPDTYNTDVLNKAGEPVTKAKTLGDVLASNPNLADSINNVATVGDVLNSGFNVKENNQDRDFIKAYDTVNFVDGKGTTANVTVNDEGTIANVTYNVKVDNSTVTVNDKGELVAAGKTVVAGGAGTSVTSATSNDGITTYTVSATGVETPTTNLSPNNNGTVSIAPTGNATDLVNADQITNAINNAGFNVVANGAEPKADGSDLVKAGETLSFVNGTGTTAVVTTSDDGKTTNVTYNSAVAYVNNNADDTSTPSNTAKLVGGDDTKPVQVQNVASGVREQAPVADVKAPTTAEKKGIADAITNATGDTLSNVANIGDVQAASNAAKTEVVEGTNMNVTSETGANGQTIYTVATDENVTFTNANASTVTVGAPGADSPITITNKDGKNVITNVTGNLPDTYNTDVLNKAGEPVTKAKTLGDVLASNPNLADSINNVATVGDVLNSGFNVKENNQDRDFIKAYDTVNFVDGKGTTANVTVNDEGTIANVTYNVKVDNSTVTVNDKGELVAAGKTVVAGGAGTSVTSATSNDGITTYTVSATGVETPTTNLSPNNNGTVSIAPTGNATDLVNADQITNAINNAGFNVVANGAEPKADGSDLVKAGETLSFVNGTGTTAVVTTSDDGKTTNVTYNSAVAYVNNNADDTSTPSNTAKLVGGDDTKPVQVQNVASGVREQAPVADVKAPTTAEKKGIADAITNATGDTLSNVANIGDVQAASNAAKTEVVEGTNMNVTSETGANGQTIYTVATDENVTFTNANASTVTVGAPGADSPITITNKDGKNVITNVTGNLPDTYNTDVLNKAGEPVTKAKTLGDVLASNPNLADSINNVATVGDVLNSGFNVKENNQDRDFIKAYDTVNFVDGKGTTANVTVNDEGTIANVTYNVKVDNSTVTVNDKGELVAAGKTVVAGGAGTSVTSATSNDGITTYTVSATGVETPTTNLSPNNNGTVSIAPTGNATDLVNADQITNAINNAGFNVVANGAEPKADGSDLVKAGETLSFVNGTGTTAVVTTSDDGKTTNVTYNSAVAYVNNNADDTSTPSNTAKLVGGDDTKPVQVQNVASGVREQAPVADVKAPTTAEKKGIADAITNATGDTLSNVANIGDVQAASNAAKTEVVEGTNMNVTSETGANGQTIYTVATDENVTFTNANASTVTVGAPGADSPITITNKDGKNVITNVTGNLPDTYNTDVLNKAGEPVTKAKTLGDVLASNPNLADSINNVATVGDVLNSGFNVKENNQDRDFIKAYDTVNFVDGKGTTANVTVNDEGTIANVTYNVKVDNSTVTVNDKGELVAAGKTVVAGGAGTSVTSATSNDGITTYTVSATGVETPTTNLSPNNNGTVSIAPTGNATDLVNADQITNAINNAGFNVVANGAEPKADGSDLVKAGETLSFVNGTGTTAVVTTSDDGKTTNVTYNSAVAYVNNNADDTSTPSNTAKLVGGDDTKPVQVQNVASGVREQAPVADVKAPTTAEKKGIADAITNATGDTLSNVANIGDVQAASNAAKTEVKSDKNTIDVTSNTGVNGQTVYNVEVANTTLTASTAPSTANNNTPAGKVEAPTADNATKFVNAGDLANVINNAGFTLSANGTNGSVVNAGEVVDLNNTDGNIVITKGADNNNVTFGLADTVKVGGNTANNPITINSNTGKIDGLTGNLAPTYNAGDYNVVDGKPTDTKADAPSKSATAPTPDEAKAMYNNAATVGDVLNAGWNIKGNGEDKDVVKPYDTVDFVNGTGTTAVVQTSEDGKVTNVTFNSALAYTDNNGNTTDASGKPLSPTNSVKLVGGDKDAPVTITGATSGLTPTPVSTFPSGIPTGTTGTPVTANLINFDNNPASRIPDSTVATVGDLRNMGWVVSTSKGNGYSDVVRSSNEVDFVGADGVTVTGETVGGKRIITISGGGNGGTAVTAGTNTNVTNVTTNHPNGTTSVNYTVNVPNAPLTNNANGSVNVPTTPGLANATDVANAVNNSGWNAQANGANGTLVKPSDTVSFNNGDNINITKDGNNITVSTTDDINVRGNLTVAGNTTLGNTEFRPNSTINAGGNQITNVAPGEVSANSTDAVNGSQLYQAYQVLGGNNQNITTVNPTTPNTTTPTPNTTTPVPNTTAGNAVINAAPNSTVTVTTNNVTNVPTSNNYTMVTYNVEGQKNYITNNVIEAIGRINEQGIQFFHTNDGTNKTRAIQGENNVDSSASGAYATAVGYRSEAAGVNAVAMGKGSKALAEDSIAIGTGNVVTGKGSGAIGDPTLVTGDASYSVGNNNTLVHNDTFAIGSNIKQTQANSVFMGNNTGYTYATGTDKDLIANASNASVSLVDASIAQGNAKAAYDNAVNTEKATMADAKATQADKDNAAKAVQDAQTAWNTANATLANAQTTATNALADVKASEEKAVANSIATNTGRTAGTSKALTSQTVAGLTEDNKFAGGAEVVGVVSVGVEKTVVNTTTNATEVVHETRRIQNVAPGLLSADSTDAINGSQLYALASNINKNAAHTVTVKKDGQDVATGNTINFMNGTGTVVNVSNTPVYTQTSTGDVLTANTDPAGVVTYTKQDGTTVASGDVTTTNTPTVTVNTAVAYVGGDKPNDSTNTAQLVGAKEGDNVQLGNVASGVATKNEAGDLVTPTNIPQAVYNATGPTLNNAATIGDIKAVAGDIHNRIDDVVDDANAGISSAMAAASLPQAYLPGKSMITGGVASYNGQGAVAVGMSKLSDNGRWVLKLHGSADTRGNVGGAVGAGFHF